jgi:hypothetical protein
MSIHTPNYFDSYVGAAAVTGAAAPPLVASRYTPSHFASNLQRQMILSAAATNSATRSPRFRRQSFQCRLADPARAADNGSLPSFLRRHHREGT